MTIMLQGSKPFSYVRLKLFSVLCCYAGWQGLTWIETLKRWANLFN